jgi:RNA polymerase sigma factor (sigma-70 family)
MSSVGAKTPEEWSAADLGALFVRNRSELLAHARRVTRTSSEAEEIVQDSLVRVLLASPELQSFDHALSYFHRVIENLSIDLQRREGRQPNLVVLDDVTSEIEAQWNADPEFSDQIASANDAAIVREAISLLSPAERAALVLWEFEGRSTIEIARELGIKESSVRHTLSRARARLRRILSERIIDEERSLTALDLLSTSYRRAEGLARRSSKAALSLILVFAAILGFNSFVSSDFVANESMATIEGSFSEGDSTLSLPERPIEAMGERSIDLGLEEKVQDVALPFEESTSRSYSGSGFNLVFAGLDEDGIPTGFTIADSLGSQGSLFAGRQTLVITETGLLLSNIVSTHADATNLLINQSIVVDAFGTSYIGDVALGISGGWQPLNLSYVSSDVERLASGSYLLTAIMMVDSVLETTIKVPSNTRGTDLVSAPEFVLTRVILDQTKTRILAQAVFVSANSQEDGA